MAVSVLLRVAAFLQLSDGHIPRQHLWAQSDMSYFDSWGAQIAEGDVLSANVQHPLHLWHVRIANLALGSDVSVGIWPKLITPRMSSIWAGLIGWNMAATLSMFLPSIPNPIAIQDRFGV